MRICHHALSFAHSAGLHLHLRLYFFVIQLYTIPIQDDTPGEKMIVYRPLLGLAFIGNSSMAELARQIAGSLPYDPPAAEIAPQNAEAVSFLENLGFLKPDPPLPVVPAFQPTTAVLMLTNSCQLRCVYCYAAAGEMPGRGLSFESGRAVIDYVFDRTVENGAAGFEVYLHGGGEPTYHWQVLQQLVAYTRTLPLPARLSLTSNGVWSPAQLDWITANMDGVGISMDGAPATQDRQRPVKSGQGSSAIVMRNLAELDRRGFQYGMRITALPPFDSLVEDVRFICQATGAHIIQVEPAYNFQRGSLAQPAQQTAEQFVQAFAESFEIARGQQRDLYYSGARPDTVTSRFCKAPYEAVIVTPDDRIVACYEVVSSRHQLAELSTVGRVVDGKVMLEEKPRQQLFDLLERRTATCAGCFCAWSCAGDCYTRAFLDGVERGGEHSLRCEVNRRITQHILLSGIERGGGVWRVPRGKGRRIVQTAVVPSGFKPLAEKPSQ